MSYNLLIVWGTVPRSLNVVILHTQNTLKCAILEEKFQNCVPTPVGMGTTPPHTQLPRGLRATRRSPPPSGNPGSATATREDAGLRSPNSNASIRPASATYPRSD